MTEDRRALKAYQRDLVQRSEDPAAAAALVETMMGTICSLANRYAFVHNLSEDDIKDLKQEGRIACWLAIADYDPSFGAAFSTFSYRAIKWAIHACVAQSMGPVSLAQKTFDKRGMKHRRAKDSLKTGRLTSVQPPDQEDRFFLAEVRPRLRAAIDQLPERWRRILEMELDQGMNGPQIAEVFGVKRQAIDQSRDKAIEQLRRAIVHGQEMRFTGHEVSKKEPRTACTTQAASSGAARAVPCACRSCKNEGGQSASAFSRPPPASGIAAGG